MKQVFSLAEVALEKGELPIAALLVLDDKVIASSYTKEVSEKRFLVHAELNTLIEADKLGLSYPERRRCRLYANLEPCPMCFGASMSFFVGSVIFSLESPGDGASELIKNWERQSQDIPGFVSPTVASGVLRSQSIELFKKYVTKHSKGPMWEWAKTLANL